MIVIKLLKDVNLGARIQKLRQERQLTQVQVIALLQLQGSKLSETAYSKLEGGHRNLYVADLLRLKDIFGVEFNDFFEGLEIAEEADAENL